MEVMTSASAIAVLFSALFLQGASSFRDITDDVFGGAQPSVLGAFGDFNSDKLTDLFLASNDSHRLEIWVATGVKPSFHKSEVQCTVPGVITGIMPGDFDGDSIMDVLVTSKDSGSKSDVVDVRIFWGRLRMGVDCANSTHVSDVGWQPLLFDYNGDRIVDLLSARIEEPHSRTVWTFGPSRTPTTVALGVGTGALSKPHSNSFVDLNDDMTADLMLTAHSSMEVWYWVGNSTFHGPNKREYPSDAAVKGQSLFVDVDADGDMEHVMPVCLGSADCKRSAIVVLNGSQWVTWFESFQDSANNTWKFHVDEGQPADVAMPVALRSADVDMDGYPDFLAILEGKLPDQKKAVTRATLLLNVHCPSCPYGRNLVPYWNYGALANFDSAKLAAFFDIDEDGHMDILLTNGTRQNGFHTYALRNQFSDDACFIKVLALSGLCYYDCPQGHLAYGTNQPGPLVRYRIITSSGYPQESCASQLYQSAHYALQLPYSVFGLGQSPNFVDVLTVALANNESVEHLSVHHQWTQIIPNSQMVVIPYPVNDPPSWVNKLFVTPGRQVLLTFIALAGTCVFIVLIIGTLHWLEKREDRRMKLQEAHQFHFDAM
uniref:Integrin alpha FG-GAP repeat containing protein 1 n=1 Tax=Rhipicephalus zambeziensis TaxID=60191 RepID=A0A224Z258_9ACAR